MTRNAFLLFFLFLTFVSNSQTYQKVNINELVSDFITTQKIDTLITYKKITPERPIFIVEPSSDEKDTCFDDLVNPPVYVFWKKQGSFFLTKINYCHEYTILTPEDTSFWNIYFSNKTVIDNEKGKLFEYINIKKEKYAIGIGNSTFQELCVIVNGNKTEKLFDIFNLQKESDGLININYKHNINLKSKLIIDLLEKTTSEAEKNNNFKK
ncbi:hypothetical protein [Flavobacterium foetidum]|uniref:hypothetical protein n=1 Tax=Flavobacterium foetidum TaxID=2026681 RepID=UPI0010756122|nr:hypothetical protein [Flavobacterium foetidum]KAF2517363.1 hypothetical protein E0W73_04490 [Flavobacterium foetidum]